MHEYREEDARGAPSSRHREAPLEASRDQLIEVGNLHYSAAAFGSAAEYFAAALSRLSEEDAEPRFDLELKLAACHQHQGRVDQALSYLESARNLVRPGDDVASGRVSLRNAQIEAERGAYASATELARDAFAVLSPTQHHAEVGHCLMVLGKCSFRLGRMAKAQEYYQDALATYRRIDAQRAQIQVLMNLGLIAKNQCRWHRSLRYFERAEKLLQDAGATFEKTMLHLNRAILFRKMGRQSEALASAETGLRIARAMGDEGRATKLKLLLGQLRIDLSAFTQAEKELLEARVSAERHGLRRELALADEFLGDLMLARENFEEAESNYALAEDRARRISESNDILAEVLRRRAALALERGEFEEARALALEALEVAEACGEEFEKPFLHRTLAAAQSALGEEDAALDAYNEALAGFRSLRLPVEIAACLMQMADFHLQSGGRDQNLMARRRVQEALELEVDDPSVSPCSLQLQLARLELSLGNYDEALLALFEVERLSCSTNGNFDRDVEGLRAEIEAAMASQARDVCSQVQLMAQLPDLLDDEEMPVSKGLDSVVLAIAERLGAQRAAVWVAAEGGRAQLAASWECAADEAKALGERALKLLRAEGVTSGPRVFSRTVDDANWKDSPARESAVAFALEGADEAVGVVYLDAERSDSSGLRLDGESLAMASTYIHLVQSTILAELRRRDTPRVRPSDEPAFQHVLTSSERVLEVLRLCSKVAPSPYTVLFTGETGVGKGLLARTVHELSPRRDRALVSVNCAAIPETLLESELFGHVRGSFTGAERDREGLVTSAHGGTLFLDEVGKMSLPMQSKLLHFLDTRELRPVGGQETRRVDVRVICATKRDLEALVETGEFLEDLYYRLLDFPIEVPPLRERDDDVLLLARHYVEKCAAELGRELPRMTRGFAKALRDFNWPGNVRQLEKVIQRACILAQDDDRLRESHLGPEILRGSNAVDERLLGDEDATVPLKSQVSALERRVIQRALEREGWNRTSAAKELQISYPTLLQKIRLYDLNPLS